MLIKGVSGVLSRERDAVFLAQCSLEHEWMCIQQDAILCFYSLVYIEAVFSFTIQIVDNGRSVGCLLWELWLCGVCRRMQSSYLSAV